MLVPFSKIHFALIIDWVDSPELMMLYSGPDFEYPWTKKVLSEYLENVKDRERFIYAENDEPIGYGEILYNGEYQPRLGRLLIGGSQNRGKGHGQVLIRELIRYIRAKNTDQTVYLFVYSDNARALRAYEKAGFKKAITSPFALPDINKRVWLMKYD